MALARAAVFHSSLLELLKTSLKICVVPLWGCFIQNPSVPWQEGFPALCPVPSSASGLPEGRACLSLAAVAGGGGGAQTPGSADTC